MSWLPTFQLGVWTAWILALFFILHPLLMQVVDKIFGSGDVNQKMGEAAG